MNRTFKCMFEKLREIGFDVYEVAPQLKSNEAQMYAINYNMNEVPLKMLREQIALRDARNALACALLDERIPVEFT